ncbi:aspartate/glutamate racemase family protein [Croceicoccus sp. YJ47]|uniref:aspartate/glutamate racemase family protein n=1 Tax=Croceicoccus sp. YJ47 TaxID=2798724 RepID=UPI0019234F88|nr:amino acid racemase [Croceicoccus sp. YJ47]QQN75853.1 amino acid racemase [Croceicoccus sp. YJ47]
MRKLGLIGGMSWVSTRAYYEDINRIVQRQAGPESSAPMLIESLNFRPLYRIGEKAEWDRAADVLIESARRLESAGAEGLVIAANSMHHVYDKVAAAVSIPIIHIADCVAKAMQEKGVDRAALLGSRNVMMQDFYRERLVAQGIEILPPDEEIADRLDAIIYDELMIGKVTRSSERELKTILTNLGKDGAEAVVLGCTELELIVDTDANVLPVFDGAHIHARAAAEFILGEG